MERLESENNKIKIWNCSSCALHVKITYILDGNEYKNYRCNVLVNLSTKLPKKIKYLFVTHDIIQIL